MTARCGVVIAMLVGFLTVCSESAFAQCVMCRRALESPEGQQVIAAFRSGILVLLAAPFVVFAAVATLAIRDQRRRNAAQDRAG